MNHLEIISEISIHNLFKKLYKDIKPNVLPETSFFHGEKSLLIIIDDNICDTIFKSDYKKFNIEDNYDKV